jgi:AmmeMemoRadiSam system protein A
MRSPDEGAEEEYDEQGRHALREVAHASIAHGFREGVPLAPEPSDYVAALREQRGTFVTLRKKASGALRGCVGGLEGVRPLVTAVAESAFNAAFRDSRFPGLERHELAELDIHISILSPLREVEVGSERELCERLRPGVDGLVLAEGRQTATFLPDVWQSLTSPERFVRELKKKAGLPADHWSPSMRVQLYTSESF